MRLTLSYVLKYGQNYAPCTLANEQKEHEGIIFLPKYSKNALNKVKK